MKRSPEWYELEMRRQARWKAEERARKAREWNGHKDTDKLGNVEFVTVMGGDAKASGTGAGAKRAQAVRLSNPSAGTSGPPTPLYPLVTLCRSMKIQEPVPEHRFHKQRKWRFDYCWPDHMLALEVEGGLWTNGRHSRGSGAIADLEKYSEAAILGWRILYCTPEQMHNGVALDRIVRALTDREAA